MKEKSILVLRIFLANLLIPFAVGMSREMLVGIFNPYVQKTFSARLLFSLRPINYLAILVFSVLSSFVIVKFLKPLLTFLDTGNEDPKARSAALRVPWFLTVVHLASWAAGVTVFYAFVFHWKAPGGYSYVISLGNIVGAGLITGIMTALYINNMLLPAKMRLNMTSIEKGERDLFLKYKNFLIVAATSYNLACFLYLVMIFFINAEEVPTSYFSPGVSMILVALFWGGVCTLLMFFSRREDTFQYKMIQKKLLELNEAGGDLTENIPLVNFDEIGHICHLTNNFISLLRQQLAHVLSKTNSLVITGKSLSESIGEAATAVDATFDNIIVAREMMGKQLSGVNDSTERVANIFNSVTRFDTEYRKQSSLIEGSSQKMKKLVDVFFSVQKIIESIQQEFVRLRDAAGASSSEITNMSKEIQTLDAYTSRLNDANQLISDVAARTNLLAMNAAIEAAHAGDSGRGFAVVAGEIRKLAEHTAAQSSDITSLLKLTFETVSKVTGRMQSTIKTMESFNAIVKSMQTEEKSLAEQLLENHHLSSETLSEIADLDTLTHNVQNEFSIILSETRTIEEQMAELESSSHNLDVQVKEIDAIGNKVKQKLSEMETLGGSNKENISGIENSIRTFKV